MRKNFVRLASNKHLLMVDQWFLLFFWCLRTVRWWYWRDLAIQKNTHGVSQNDGLLQWVLRVLWNWDIKESSDRCLLSSQCDTSCSHRRGAGLGNRVLSFSNPLDDINDQRRLFPTKDLIQSFAQNHDNLYSLEQTIQVENAWFYWHGQVESRKFWNFDPIFDLICVPFVLGGWGENL